MTTTLTAPVGSDALRHACRELDLGDAVANELLARVGGAFDAMARREAEMMRLLGTAAPEKLVHDLRNVLNEVALLKAAADL